MCGCTIRRVFAWNVQAAISGPATSLPCVPAGAPPSTLFESNIFQLLLNGLTDDALPVPAPATSAPMKASSAGPQPKSGRNPDKKSEDVEAASPAPGLPAPVVNLSPVEIATPPVLMQPVVPAPPELAGNAPIPSEVTTKSVDQTPQGEGANPGELIVVSIPIPAIPQSLPAWKKTSDPSPIPDPIAQPKPSVTEGRSETEPREQRLEEKQDNYTAYAAAVAVPVSLHWLEPSRQTAPTIKETPPQAALDPSVESPPQPYGPTRTLLEESLVREPARESRFENLAFTALIAPVDSPTTPDESASGRTTNPAVSDSQVIDSPLGVRQKPAGDSIREPGLLGPHSTLASVNRHPQIEPNPIEKPSVETPPASEETTGPAQEDTSPERRKAYPETSPHSAETLTEPGTGAILQLSVLVPPATPGRETPPALQEQSASAPLAPDLKSETKPAGPSQPLREIAVRVEQADSSRLEIKLTDRFGQMQVAVRTGDRELAKTLQADLGDLVSRLEDKGFKAAAWAGGPNAANRGEFDPAPHAGAEHHPSWDQGGRNPQDEHGMPRRPRQQTASQNSQIFRLDPEEEDLQ